MNFKNLICLFGLAALLGWGPSISKAADKSSSSQAAPAQGPDLPEKICNQATNAKDCLCRNYSDQAVNNYCVEDPYDESTKKGNPLFDSDAQSKLSEAKGIVGSGDSSTTDACQANGATATTGVEVLKRMQARCQQFISQCQANCSSNPSLAANYLPKCTQASVTSETMSSDQSSLQAEVSRDKACKQDASNDDKKNQDDSGMQMPQMSSNSCSSDPTSASCQQLVQSCAVASYAATNPVCKCFGGSKDPSCGGTQTTPAEDPGSDGGGGGGSSYGGTDTSSPASTSPSTSGNAQSAAMGAVPFGGGGNGLQGTNGGANKADIPEYDDPKALNTSVLGGKVGGASAAGGAGGGYSKDGNWIPPNLKDRKPSSEIKLQLPTVSKWDVICHGKNQPLLSNWEQMHNAAICAMKLEPR